MSAQTNPYDNDGGLDHDIHPPMFDTGYLPIKQRHDATIIDGAVEGCEFLGCLQKIVTFYYTSYLLLHDGRSFLE